MDDDIRIRAWTPDDMEGMAGLIRTREDMTSPESTEQRTVLTEWFACRNPFAGEQASYLVAERNGRLLAHLGRMPVQFGIRGRKVVGCYAADLFVAPEFRREGLGFMLTMSMTKKLEEEIPTFFGFFSPTPLHVRMQRRRKHHEMPPLVMYTKLFDPRQLLDRTVRHPALVRLLRPPLTLGLRAADAIASLLRPGGLPIERLPRFDERYERFYERILPKLGIATVKSPAYLNWKYVDRPFSEAVLLAVVVGGEMRGAMVLDRNPVRETYRTGLIMEILADPDDRQAIGSLLGAAVDHFRAWGAQRINCLLTDPRFIRVIRRFLFVPVPRRRGFFLGNLAKADPSIRDLLMDLDNWHLTIGESDHNMLDPYMNPE